ncbi:pyruvate formate-lyase-activating protein [Arcanobacterium hippocoleae]|uniref:Pyruvate formate-lyase-activating enzyme n=1 Tax=Arcanobacterium hippocoleae TaxID=149017 RepID=A0ABU1T1K5_9ACTO|nr:pyruvate formate-lyase-activating protein [Arcanobacterium hippocoleae]MDR6939184.1 pyruvate formate lyase activating enzyme [Arcanobacterium hippocoleae]
MSKVPIRFSSEGSTGEYRPEPSEIEVPRLDGAGIDGIEPAEDLGRSEHLKAVRAGEVGSIHSWELVTAVDGPGTRMTTFFSGCPLRCVYCHNPDTLQMRDGTAVTAEALLKKIKRYRAVFRTSGGGVTFSGGEPLFQPAFLAHLLRECKKLGIHTAIDTSGFLGAALTDEMMENLDLVLLDVKSGISETYKRTTDRELEPTLRFGKRLSDAGKPIWVRFVLVPGWTDAPENVEAVADIVAKWKSVERVEVLPFHQMARDKWDNLGLEYQLEAVEPPSKEATEQVREVFRARGLLTF